MRESGASELRKFFALYVYSKHAISFNILLILQILCRFVATDKSLTVPATKLRKSNGGGGAGSTPLITLVLYSVGEE